MTFSQAAFLGVVSWQFILVTTLPPLGYNTRLDDFTMLSLFVISMMYVPSVSTPVCMVMVRVRVLVAAVCLLFG